MPFSDPAVALQTALVAHLKADAGVTAVCAGRVFDAVKLDAVLPYVAFGPFQMLPEHGDCLDGCECFIQLDAYAPGPDTKLIKIFGAALAAALDEAEVTLNNHRLVGLSIEQTQYLRDPDGITTHAVISVRALTDPT